MMSVLSTEMPPEIASALQAAGYNSRRLSEEALKHFAEVLYRRQMLSLEQAAQLAQMNLWEFLPFLSEQGIAIADYDAEETNLELETARWLSRKFRMASD